MATDFILRLFKDRSGMKKFSRNFLLFNVFILGVSVLILEILGSRVISPFYGSSVIPWSALIGTTLASLAAGYFVGGVLADQNPRPILFFIEMALAGFLVLFIPLLRNPVLSATSALGLTWGSLVSAVLLFAPSLIVMSATGPLAIRLVTAEFVWLGRSVGRVYTVSTAGSVLGALFTGFYLIPHFSIRAILFTMGLTLMALASIGFLILNKKIPAGFLLATVLIGISLLNTMSTSSTWPGMLFNQTSFYNEIKVVDENGYRYLYIDGACHGCIDLQNHEAQADYLFYLELLPYLKPDAKRALLIGLGPATLPEAYRRHYNLVTDIVDIDPMVIKVAQQYFDFQPMGAAVAEDGRAYLERTRSLYDFIIIDAYAAERMAFHLFTKECFTQAQLHLVPKGILALEVVGNPDREGWVSIYKTLKSIFPFVRLFASYPEGSKDLGNIVCVASSVPFPDPIDVSSARPIARENLETMLTHELVTPAPNRLNRAVVLTDDFNPIDLLFKDVAFDWRTSIINTYKDLLLFDGNPF